MVFTYKMLIVFLVNCGILLIPQSLRAEGGCPAGYYPYGATGVQVACAPMPGSAPVDPGPHWASRWGAIAVDSVNVKWGYFDGARNKRLANKAAINACRENGGKKCKVLATYYNQCGAMASGAATTTTYRAPDIEQAEKGAMDFCSEQTIDCAVIHSGCSYPEQIR